MDQDNAMKPKNERPTNGWRAYCQLHDWEGVFQKAKSEAEKDFDAHNRSYPEDNCYPGTVETDS